MTAISLGEKSHQRTSIQAGFSTCTMGDGVRRSVRAPLGMGLLFAPLRLKAVQQALQLLFAQVYLILQLPLLDDKG